MSYHTLPTKYCFAEYEFCVEFVTCVQCALKSQVRPQCGDGIEFRPSLPEDQAGGIHAISPFWMKLCQIEGTTQ